MSFLEKVQRLGLKSYLIIYCIWEMECFDDKFIDSFLIPNGWILKIGFFVSFPFCFFVIRATRNSYFSWVINQLLFARFFSPRITINQLVISIMIIYIAFYFDCKVKNWDEWRMNEIRQQELPKNWITTNDELLNAISMCLSCNSLFHKIRTSSLEFLV